MSSQEKKITIALDAMGGANAPLSVLEGADKAKAQYPGVRFLLYGNKDALEPILAGMPDLQKICEIIHTDDVILDDEKPSVALRRGQNSSMGLAIKAVREKKADGVVSAGNTGALMVMSKLQLRMLDGIDRPAIATVFPTMQDECVILDLGANVECSATNLFQFAVMGDAFARAVLGHTNPQIGLLNIGSEEMKGNEVVKTAAQMIRDTKLPLTYYGNIEGDDIGKGTTDVVVTDGFTGNIALKTAEGTANMFSHYLKQSYKSSLLSKLGFFLSSRALKKMFNKLDPRNHNGAMFLGLNGIVVKSHGSADSHSFSNAIGVSVKLVAHNINERIIQEMTSSGEAIAEEKEQIKA